MEVFNKFQANRKYWNTLLSSLQSQVKVLWKRVKTVKTWRWSISSRGSFSTASPGQDKHIPTKIFCCWKPSISGLGPCSWWSHYRGIRHSHVYWHQHPLSTEGRRHSPGRKNANYVQTIIEENLTRRHRTDRYSTWWALITEDLLFIIHSSLTKHWSESQTRRILAWSDGNHCTRYEDLESGSLDQRQTRTNEVLLSSISGVPSLSNSNPSDCTPQFQACHSVETLLIMKIRIVYG